MDKHTFNENMLNLIYKGKVLCKFEKFESAKAFDWITDQGYRIVRKDVIPFMWWELEKL